MTAVKEWDGSLCPSCGKNPAEEPHTCPYREDVHEDSEYQCTCCPYCTAECVMDI
jgi:hypothetical protein